MMKFLFQAIAACLILHQIACDECDTLPDLKQGFGSASCCRIPILYNQSWIEDCKIELNLTEKLGPKQLDDECKMYECMFKRGGGIVDGKPSAAEIKKQMKSILDLQPGWETVFNAAVDKCVPEVITKKDETRKLSSEPPYNIDKTINTMYGHLVTCIGAHLFLECPMPVDGDSPNCITLKNYIKKCANEFPPRFMKPPAK